MSSAGAEAVDLLKAANRPPDKWQAGALHVGLAEEVTGMYAASEVGLIVPRQNGKGDVLLGKALHSLYLSPVKLILWSAHEFKTVRQMFLRVRATIDGCYDLRKRVKRIRTSHGEESVELNDDSTLYFVARSSGSGRGFSPEELLWDEAYALTDEQVSAQMPSTAAQPNAQIWYASSHPLVTSLVLRKLCLRGRKGSPGLAYMEWGGDPERSRDDKRTWREANPGYPHRLTERSMVRLLGAMTEVDFDREMLGLVDLESDADVPPIDLDLWTTLVDGASDRPVRPALAVDITPERSFSVVATAGKGDDDRTHVDVIDHGPGTGWALDRAVERYDELDACVLVLDPAGPAGSLIKGLIARGFVAVDPKPESKTGKLRPLQKGQRRLLLLGPRDAAQAHGAFVDAANNDQLRHRDRLELNKAIAGAKTRPLADAAAWSRKDSSVDISPLVAVTEAAYGFATFGAVPEQSKRKPKFAFG